MVGGPLAVSVCLAIFLLLSVGAVLGSPQVSMHRMMQEELAGNALLPCSLHPPPGSPAHDPPAVRWTKVWGQRGGDDGSPREQSILVAKGNVLEVTKAFLGRVSLPSYRGDPYNATLGLAGLRSSDSGVYHCQVTTGNNIQQDTVALEVKGLVFHYRSPRGRYTLSFSAAQRACLQSSALMATPAQLHAAFSDGYGNCEAGWLSDQTVRYSIQSPGPGCYGDGEDSPGVRSYGNRDSGEMFDVYCFAKQLQGEVFYSSDQDKLSLWSASSHCESLGGQLASVGQLFLAWQRGLDQCDPGWLSDGSVRYPINQPRPDCGGDRPGVRTLYRNPNGSGYHDTSALFDAYCYREKWAQPMRLSRPTTLETRRATGPVSQEKRRPPHPTARTGPAPPVVTTPPPQPASHGSSAGEERLGTTSVPPPPAPQAQSWSDRFSNLVDPQRRPWSSWIGSSEGAESKGASRNTTTERERVGAGAPHRALEGRSNVEVSEREVVPKPGLNGLATKPTPAHPGTDSPDPPRDAVVLRPRALVAGEPDRRTGLGGRGAGPVGAVSRERLPALASGVFGRRSDPGPEAELGLSREQEEGPGSPRPIPEADRTTSPAGPSALRAGGRAVGGAGEGLYPEIPVAREQNQSSLKMAIASTRLPGVAVSLVPWVSSETLAEDPLHHDSDTPPSASPATPRPPISSPTHPSRGPTALPTATPTAPPTALPTEGAGWTLPNSAELGRSNLSQSPAHDACQSNPCQNGGTCFDKTGSFLCLCLASYTGATCDKDTEACEQSWKKFRGHCYRYFTHRHTWEDAERTCREHGGHLASVHSSAEQDFLNGMSQENTWIGLNDRIVEDDFQWTDGMELEHENWRENQPDNFFAGGEDCVVMVAHESGKWNDVPCNYNLPYTCKKATVLCGPPPSVEHAFLIGHQLPRYDVHSVVRYQCAPGLHQRHAATTKCRGNGRWDTPKMLCTKSRRPHRYRRHHHQSRRGPRRHGPGGRHGDAEGHAHL